MFRTRVYYSNGNVHYEGYSKRKSFSQQTIIDDIGIFLYNLDGFVRRYDANGNLIETLRLQNGKKILLPRQEVQKNNTNQFPNFINIGDQFPPCINIGQESIPLNSVNISENYSGELDQYGNECGKGIFFYTYKFSYQNEENDEEQIYIEKKILYVGGFQDGKRCGQGTLYNKNGTLLYKGEWKNNRPHGIGTSYYSNGIPFVKGHWKCGSPFSNCLIYNKNHTLVFNGFWQNYEKDGFLFDFKTGEVLYYGLFKHGLPHGFGTSVKIDYLSWYGRNDNVVGPIKLFYHGFLNLGQLSGHFTVECKDPDENLKMYEGTILHGKKNGFGIDNSRNYIGYFKNDLREGYGKLFQTDDNIDISNYKGKDKTNLLFEGLFLNNLPYKGTMYFENGEIMYEGDLLHDFEKNDTFEDDCSSLYGFYHGFGKSYYPSGKLCYEGQWEYSLQVGEGTFYSEDGNKIHKNEYRDGAWYGLGIYYGNSRNDKVLYNGHLRNGLPHGDGVIFEYNSETEAIESVFGGEFFNGKYTEAGVVYDTTHEIIFEGEVNENCDYITGVEFLNDEAGRTVQWKNGKVFDENEERLRARQHLYLSAYLENGNPFMLHKVSKSVCKKMYYKMFGANRKASKKSLIREMMHRRKKENKSPTADPEPSNIDLFGNKIVTPVTGNDGQIYDLQSMMKLFAINHKRDYTIIKYRYEKDERVPNYPNTGFVEPLSGFYLSPEICKNLSLVLTHEQMNTKTIQFQFLSACENGDFKKVKELIKNGVDINEKHHSGMTSLMYACQNGHLNIVKYLVRRGVDVNCKTKVCLSVNDIALQKLESNNHEKIPLTVLDDTTPPILCNKVSEDDGIFYGRYVY